MSFFIGLGLDLHSILHHPVDPQGAATAPGTHISVSAFCSPPSDSSTAAVAAAAATAPWGDNVVE